MKSAIVAILLVPGLALAQAKETPIVKPDAETMAKIIAKLKRLQLATEAHDNCCLYIPDVRIYAKAVEWMIRHEEYYGAKAGEQMLVVLDAGLKRAEELEKNPDSPSWLAIRGKPVIRGYRSGIDGSIQPYVLTIPEGFDPKRTDNRLDVVLAGRDGTKSEVKWIHRCETAKPGKSPDRMVLEPYGRGNNAYRWAGEKDVFEAIHALKKQADDFPFDERRVVLRGFSMGGAGTWHIGLHHPSEFAAISPGAGFTETKSYAKLPKNLPDYVEKCLHIYDAVDYAENSSNVPVIAYSGEKDGQIAAARNIERRLAEVKAKPITHFIAPGLEHKQPPEWLKKIDDELMKSLPRQQPKEIQFTTYTPKYGQSDWIHVEAMERLYERATVTGKLVDGSPDVKTENVRSLGIGYTGKAMNTVIIDGQRFEYPTNKDDPSYKFNFTYYLKRNGLWKSFSNDENDAEFVLSKRDGLQGPIDDAFAESFQVVGPNGVPMHKDASLFISETQKRFWQEWDKWMRGQHQSYDPAKDEPVRSLVLFGDPGSNPLIAKWLPKLPITWNEKDLIVNGVRYDPKTHLPVMIYPVGGSYIVLNSGHTFHEADFKGTNALLYPRLGDWAVLKPKPTKADPCAAEVVAAGLFDENWKFAKAK